jgi:hypothetical protein
MSASPPLATASSSRPAPSPGRTVALPPTSFGQFASDGVSRPFLICPTYMYKFWVTDRDMDLSCAGVVFLESAMDANGVDDNRASVCVFPSLWFDSVSEHLSTASSGIRELSFNGCYCDVWKL